MSNYDHPFREGQRVRCVVTDWPARVGDVVTVRRTAPGSSLFSGGLADGRHDFFINARFEPYVEAPITADVDFPRYQQDRQVDDRGFNTGVMGLWEAPGHTDLMVSPEGINEALASDPVFRPNHYARFIIEPLTFINANKLPANVANVVKYVCRFDAKDGRQDLQKARRYIDIQLECMDRDDRVAAGEDPNAVWSSVL